MNNAGKSSIIQANAAQFIFLVRSMACTVEEKREREREDGIASSFASGIIRKRTKLETVHGGGGGSERETMTHI